MKNQKLYKSMVDKYSMKLEIYNNAHYAFSLLKDVVKDLGAEFQKQILLNRVPIPFEYKFNGDYEIELKFGSDVLIFVLHTNVFEFDRNHEVRKTSYVQEDHFRSYCGVIQIYNFLYDSFKYNRVDDIGYLIARIFVNKEMHYFIEGKREVGMLYNNFANSQMNIKEAKKIVESAMQYCINFDLLNPPYDEIKEMTVAEMQDVILNMQFKTAKRLGFRFLEDNR